MVVLGNDLIDAVAVPAAPDQDRGMGPVRHVVVIYDRVEAVLPPPHDAEEQINLGADANGHRGWYSE